MHKRTRRGVRNAYTYLNLKDDLVYLHDAKGGNLSLRKIAARYGVTHAVIHRILTYDMEPKNREIRNALGLKDYALVEICPKCEQLHELKQRCPGATTKYAPHPVMRLSRLRSILTSPYKDS